MSSPGYQLVVSFACRWSRTESVVDADDPGHALLSLNGREHLGRVLESDWAFTQRVGDRE
jgi:hypothetical protein